MSIKSEKETKIHILNIALARGCQNEARAVYDKYTRYLESDKFDPSVSTQIAKSFIAELAKVDIYLIAWMAEPQTGHIYVNGELCFTVEDVPEY